MEILNYLVSQLSILIVIAVIVAIIYFAIRRTHGDEQDRRMWDKRIGGAIVSGVIGVAAAVLVNWFLNYFK